MGFGSFCYETGLGFCLESCCCEFEATVGNSLKSDIWESCTWWRLHDIRSCLFSFKLSELWYGVCDDLRPIMPPSGKNII